MRRQVKLNPDALEDEVIVVSGALPGTKTGTSQFLFQPTARRVRTTFAGETVADSRQVMLLHESQRLPVYYFPREDVRLDLLQPSEHTKHAPGKGKGQYWHVRVGDRVAEDAAWAYPEPEPGCPDISAYIAFYWNRMDAWYEEDEEVFVHPRDPYHRVDVLKSSRHVRVELSGETVAETTQPRLLFETGLPTRYYIPQQDVRMDLLTATDTHTACPYKGNASYWSARVGDELFKDIVWSYPEPIPECGKIEDLVSFFNEHVDIYVDGELQSSPETPWS